MLSLFCAKAGAKHMYAVECSQMADMAQEIVKDNGFSNVITVLKGNIEEIELLVAQVDIIISEWMGYFLLYENMLNTVLYAWDKWLRSLSNGKLTRRTGGTSAGSPSPASLKRGSQKRKVSTTMMQDKLSDSNN